MSKHLALTTFVFLSSTMPFLQAPIAADQPASALRAYSGVAPQTLAGRTFLTVPGAQWKLQWNDEFEGDKLDTSKWSIGLPWGGTDGAGRHHNDQYASYIMDDDVNVHGGSLHLTTQRRDVVDKKGRTFRYTEGMITSSKQFRTAYGYFEIEAKMPTEAGPGTWPAFWTLADGWPPEFDIIEYWGSDNRIHQGTVTRKADGGQRWDSYHQRQTNMSGWHTYGLEWGPGYQAYNIDGKVTYTIYGNHIPPTPHYILLNSGVETVRPPRPGTKFPNDFEVRYVRVYARPDVPALLNGGFELEGFAPWERQHEASVVDYGARSGTRCIRVDAGGPSEKAGSLVRQTVYGLKPNTRYVLTGYARTSGGVQAKLGVKDHGAAEMKSSGMSRGNGFFPVALSFTTGAEASSAQIMLMGDGEGTVFFDDVQIEQRGAAGSAR